MGARRYGIYLQVEQKGNSLATSNHVLFCLSYRHHNTLQEKPTSSMNENK